MKRGLVWGSFDPLHAGHVRLLRACRAQCDHLTVVVHTDARVARLKRRTSPFPLHDRIQDVAELRCVDEVLAGDDRTKLDWIGALTPAVVFVGEETTAWPWTTPTVVMPRTPGISSTMLRTGAVE